MNRQSSGVSGGKKNRAQSGGEKEREEACGHYCIEINL